MQACPAISFSDLPRWPSGRSVRAPLPCRTSKLLRLRPTRKHLLLIALLCLSLLLCVPFVSISQVSWIGDTGALSGITRKGASGWQLHSTHENKSHAVGAAPSTGPLYLHLDVNTTKSHFKHHKPLYFPTLIIGDGPFICHGSHTIYHPTRTGFRVYVRIDTTTTSMDTGVMRRTGDVSQIEQLGWRVSWIGVDPDVVDPTHKKTVFGTRRPESTDKSMRWPDHFADIASVTLDSVVPVWEEVATDAIPDIDDYGQAYESQSSGIQGVRAVVSTAKHKMSKLCKARYGPHHQKIMGCEHSKVPAYIVAVEAPPQARAGSESLGLRVTGGEDVYDAGAGQFSVYLQLEKQLLLQHPESVGEATVSKRINSWLQEEEKKQLTWRVQYLAYVGDWPGYCKTSKWSAWSKCDYQLHPCGPLNHTRTRSIVRPAVSSGKPCMKLKQDRLCHFIPCVVSVFECKCSAAID